MSTTDSAVVEPHTAQSLGGVRKGSRVAVLESEIFESDRLVAKALGTYSIHSR